MATRCAGRISCVAALLGALGLDGCATLSPRVHGVYVDPDATAGPAVGGQPAAVLIGDIGQRQGDDTVRLARAVGKRLRGARNAPVLVLGDVFYMTGLTGLCADRDEPVSWWRCDDAGNPKEQIQSVLGPYRDQLDGNPLIAIGGNHDHYGGEEATRNACALLPDAGPGWRYIARGCGLDDAVPVQTIDLGPVVFLAIDTEPMLRDTDYREQTIDFLRRTLRFYRTQKPDTWRVVITHHPLETYGAHNGAALYSAPLKDFYSLRGTILYPLFWPIERVIGQQDVYEWRYRGLRRDLYELFSEEPIDVFVSGHDHSLQHVRIDHPGIGHQLVTGAGAYRTPIKRFGLDLLWTNRLARLLGMRDVLPAASHELSFGIGGEYEDEDLSGYGFAVLVPTEKGLGVEFWDPARSEPLYTTTLGREAR